MAGTSDKKINHIINHQLFVTIITFHFKLEMNKMLLVFGTRPELIKLALVIEEFRKRDQRQSPFIVNTNQNKNSEWHDFEYFHVEIDYQLQMETTLSLYFH